MKKSIKKQKGFTLAEMGLVLVIAAVLSVGIYAAYSANKDSITFDKINRDLKFTMPTAIQGCVNRSASNNLNGCDVNKIQRLSAFKDDSTACGDTWAVAVNSSNAKLTLTYPLTTCNDRNNLGADLVTAMEQVVGLGNVTYDAPNTQLVVIYDK